MLTKYGYNTIGVMMVIAFSLIVVFIFAQNNPIRFISLGLAIFIVVFTLNFFRDPERTTPNENGIVISPADGKVIIIKEVEENKFLNSKGTQISVFMSPLNVHVNRIPITGQVDYIKYVKGKYLVAYDEKASEENERSEIGITSPLGKVFFTQVAGYVARRIVYELKLNDSVFIGNRFGMIKFGSRVDVVVDSSWSVNVKIGDKVSAGETILFKKK